jgi:hypothetical protein
MFLAMFYLLVAFLFAGAAYLGLSWFPQEALWFCAGVFGLLGGWRVFHFIKGIG